MPYIRRVRRLVLMTTVGVSGADAVAVLISAGAAALEDLTLGAGLKALARRAHVTADALIPPDIGAMLSLAGSLLPIGRGSGGSSVRGRGGRAGCQSCVAAKLDFGRGGCRSC